jgi:hypothetical protein
MVASTFGPLEEGIAPIRVRVRALDDATVTTPHDFADHLIRVVADYATAADMLSADDRRALLERSGPETIRPAASRGGRLSLLPTWLISGAELSAEIRSVTSEKRVRRSAPEVIEQAAEVVRVIEANGLDPILVIDDSDAWLNISGMPDRSHLVSGFFSTIPRMLAEEIRCAVVFAVHEHYLEKDAYRSASGFIDTTIRLPSLPSAGSLGDILARRIRIHAGVELTEAFERVAVEELFAHYSGVAGHNIRRVITAAHTALRSACLDAATRVEAGHVEAAAAEWETS